MPSQRRRPAGLARWSLRACATSQERSRAEASGPPCNVASRTDESQVLATPVRRAVEFRAPLGAAPGLWSIETPAAAKPNSARDCKLETARDHRVTRKCDGEAAAPVQQREPVGTGRRQGGRYQQRAGVSSGSARSCASAAPGGPDQAIRLPATRWQDRGRGGRLSACDAQAGQRPVRRTTREAGHPPGPWSGRGGSEARRSGGEAQVLEDLPDHYRPFDPGDDLHRPAAARTHEGIYLIMFL